MRSLHDGRVFDMPQQTYERYVRTTSTSATTLWAPLNRARTLSEGCTLRIQTPQRTRVRWRPDGVREPSEVVTRDTTLPGVCTADLDTATLTAGRTIRLAIDGIDGEQVITVVARTA